MMETIHTVPIKESLTRLSIKNDNSGLLVLSVETGLGVIQTNVVIDRDEATELANALYAAAGVQPVIGLRGITSADFGDDNSLDAIAADPGIQRENSAITYEFDGTETDGLDDDHDTAQEAK